MSTSTPLEPSPVRPMKGPDETKPVTSRKSRSGWILALLATLAIVGAGGFYAARSGKGQAHDQHQQGSAEGTTESTHAGTTVQVVKPKMGGVEHTTYEPGTVRSFEFAPLYTKVSGYLKELLVDRGDRVKVGQLLAKIYDPELDVAVLQAQASLEHAQAMVTQSEAKLKTALAGVQAAEAQETSAKAKLDEAVAQRTYRKRALDRVTDLAGRNAVEQKLVDESEDQYMSSLASELAAQAGIKTAEAQYAEATAAVELAKADIVTAKSEVAVARANLDKSKVMVDYTRIESPYDGVVTQRGDGVHKGAFVRSATEGNQEPLLTVARTDLMRMIVQVPDRDVPFVDPGDPAIIKLDSLPDRVFTGKVSRIAEAEDDKDRAMRVEIDMVNDAKSFATECTVVSRSCWNRRRRT